MNRNIKNFALVLLTLITHLSLSAQGWERIYPGDPNSPQGYPVGLGLEVFPEANGYFVYSEFDGEKRFFRTDQDGFQTSSTLVTNYGELVVKNLDGDFIFIRRLGSPNPPEEDLALVKTDPNGNQIWEHRFGDPASSEAVTALLQSSDGNYVFAGAGYNAVTGYYPHVYKTNENGDVLWKTTHLFDYDIFDYALTETADGGYLMAGSSSYDFTGNINTVLLKLSSDGTVQWVSDLPNTLKIETILADGNEYLLWGNDLTGTALSKTDDNGNIIWTQQYGSGSGVDLLKTADGGYALLSNTGDGNIRLTKTDVDGNVQWEELYGGSLIDYARDFKATADGSYIITGAANAEGEEVSLYLIKTDAQGQANTNLIEGYVLYDVDGDCADDPTEMPLEDWIVTAAGDGATFYGTVNDNGYYRIEVGMGSWDVSVAVPNDYWMPCVASETVTFGMNFDTTQVNFAVKSVAQCPLMEVNMQAGGLRICDENAIYVNCRNQGTWIAEDAYVEIIFDDSLTVIDASVPFAPISGNTYTFELGDVDFLEEANFTVQVITSCDEELLGQALCMDATAYPDSTCLPANPQWSGASIEVSAWCEGSEVKLQLKNIGDAAMSSSLEYLVVEDDVIMNHTPFGPLEPDDFIQITKEANGTFYRIQSQQEPFHPGTSMPSAFVEGCGANENGEISLGFVNQYALDDANFNEDILCLEVVGSFDPNAKAAFPRGYHEPNYIEANTELEYVIYFQNTGTAPAYKVVIEDQLSTRLNPVTIRPGASSHSYDFELLGEGLVRFTFDNIMLPDSNTNEPESHGFVQFKIQQKTDLPIGTEIYNDAAIFFDFNAPIITNQTLHTIAEDFITVGIGPISRPNISVRVMPNPFEQSAVFEVKGSPSEMKTFQLFDSIGRLVRMEQFSGILYRFERNDLPSGVFFYTISDEHGGVNSGKVVVQ